ncbi:MAG: hypothetical protein U9N00_03785 [Candidatus Bipolaricaulota bacterium]|nr:hypothetical protein [Candidatus Bipolaricaulota bacterium]
MRTYGKSSVFEFLENFILYRSLSPLDPYLSPIEMVCDELGLPVDAIPRKTAPDYARIVVHLLREARRLEAPSVPIARLVYVGDTLLSDGTAFSNLCRAGGWPGLAFIGNETEEPTHVELVEREVGTLFLANRWSLLPQFDRFCRKRGFRFDEGTAVVIDIDKTALGARGRNDHVIDRVRIEAVRRTIGDLLGDQFDQHAFERAYERLNAPEFHPFTGDNQDHLAYLCLILGSGFVDLESLIDGLRAGRLVRFEEFIKMVDGRSSKLSNRLGEIHQQIYRAVMEGDPTPFKAFRHAEYKETLSKMGTLDDDAPVSDLMTEEILITQEVREAALAWRKEGALLFGLSDKPDEASMPTVEWALQGYLPIHSAETHAVGSDTEGG